MFSGTTLLSSGTTGPQKTIWQSPAKLNAAALVAVKSQYITETSRVYTVCKTTHAGGLLAQTMPALFVGAHVDIDTFNAYTFFTKLLQGKYTHTHLTPDHCVALMNTKAWNTVDLSGITVTCGSDRVTWDIIRGFVARGAQFIANWGMTEVGPVAINVEFNSLDDVDRYEQQSVPNTTIMGDRIYCDYKIVNNELYVRGDICIKQDEWFATGDSVIEHNGVLYYVGRL